MKQVRKDISFHLSLAQLNGFTYLIPKTIKYDVVTLPNLQKSVVVRSVNLHEADKLVELFRSMGGERYEIY